MDRSVIPQILRELNLNEDCVANIYNYGSWVYGTNTPTSDRDLLIVTCSPYQAPLEFREDFDYFHEFQLNKLWNQYDVCVHSVENFEKLLEKNYLLAIECIFLPNEFKIKEEIDFRKIYSEKYYDKIRLKKVALYENLIAINMYNLDDDTNYPIRSSISNETSQSSKDYLFKNLFHGVRYLDVGEQLIQTGSIHDYQRVSHILKEMKDIRGDPIDDLNTESVLDFVRTKSSELKSKLDALVPTNIVKGTFEAHVTFDCTYNTQETIDKVKQLCENTKYKIIYIELDTNQDKHKLQQLMTSSYHCGEYPSIVRQIEEEVHTFFQEFNIVRIKIEALASNEGVPETDMEKTLFWDAKTNCFEFHYKVLVEKDRKGEKLKKLQNVCRSNYNFRLYLSLNAFKQIDKNSFHYIITMRLFDVGREQAFQKHEQVIEFLTNNGFAPLKAEREFVVYDSHIELDDGWK